MPQHDLTITGSSSGTQLVTQLNSWESALLSSHRDNTTPTYAVDGMIWAQNDGVRRLINYWDGAQNILIGTVNTTSNTFVPAGVSSGNYFGNESDGALNITSNTTWDTEDYNGSIISSNDTGIVRRDLSSLTITNGAVVTAAYRAQCMIVYCSGDVNITNGTLHMDARGANATASAINISRDTAGAILKDETSLATYTIPAAGASGGAAVTTGGSTPGNAGSAGVNGQTGGGGSGSGGGGGGSAHGTGGAGAAGTAFCGGSGGGAGGFNGSGTNGSAGASNGGAGGAGGTNASGRASGGGAGNPAGAGNSGGGGASVSNATGGGGGTLIIIAAGNITIGAGGAVRSAGAKGGSATSVGFSGFSGGGAGGGSILMLHGGSYTNNGTVSCPGGAAGDANGTGSVLGGAGGAGSITTAKIAS